MSNSALPPSLPSQFLLGHLSELRRDVLNFYTCCARQCGDVALVYFGLRPVYLLSHPDLIEQVLTSRQFIKHYALRMSRRLLGNGLLSSEGDFWLRQRRLIQPAFLRDRLTDYAETMVADTQRWSSAWPASSRRNIHAEVRQLTMEIAAHTLFGASAEGQAQVVSDALHQVMASFSSRLFSVLRLPEWVPTPRSLRSARAVRRLDRVLYSLIDQHRASGKQDNLMALLLAARDEQDGTGMSDKQVRDEAMTLFLAGHETTALALSYGLWLLARHPEAQDRLRQEVLDLAGDRPLVAADAPRLVFTERVILEAMRLYPPAYAIGRQAVEACTLGGYTVPAGGTVLMAQWVMHRDPRFWEDPERFWLDRWANDLLRRLPKYAYFPFGGGPRICIGNHFALLESVLVLGTLLRRWRVLPADDQPLRFRPGMTLAPAGNVDLIVERI